MDYYDLIREHPELIKNQDGMLRLVLDKNIIENWQSQKQDELHQRCLPLEWAKIGVILNDPFFVVIRDLVQFPDGDVRGYSRVINQADLKRGRGVVVLPEYQGKILLLHQFRHPTRLWHYEVPRGYGEPEVSAEENASKEIKEEINGTIDELFNLGEFYNNTGLEGHAVSLFYARLSSIGLPNLNEGIDSYVQLTRNELEEWVGNGTISDGFTIAAYTRAKLKGLI